MPISALSAGVVRALGSSQVLTTPVSVVKELVDNALDARASSISIEISANTLDCIHVKDNGHGIVPEDRDHVALRHWTSKIRDLAELRTLGGKSLGFRGQALASAAEMAAGVEIVTRIEGEMTACKLVLGRLGQVLSRENASHGVGTSVRVTKFLHQIPVRKDIALKAAAKTLLQIKETLVAYALARPAVRISLRVIKAKNEKANWIYAPRKDASMEDAARCIFGKETAAQCMLVSWPLDSPVSPQVHTGTDADPEALSFCAHRFHVEAFLPKPSAELSKISGKGTFVSIDSRPVSSKKVAVRSFVTLYRDYVRVALADNASSSKIKDPLLCLNIFCPSGSYDANVEAAKDDVLFEDLKGVQDFLEAFFSSIYGVLEKRRSLENGKSLKSPPKSNAFDLLLAKKRPLQEPGRRDDAEEPSLFCSDDEAFPGLNTGDRQVAKGPKVPLSPPTSQADPSSYRAPHNGFPGSASRPRWRSNMYGDDDNDEDGDEGPLLRGTNETITLERSPTPLGEDNEGNNPQRQLTVSRMSSPARSLHSMYSTAELERRESDCQKRRTSLSSSDRPPGAQSMLSPRLGIRNPMFPPTPQSPTKLSSISLTHAPLLSTRTPGSSLPVASEIVESRLAWMAKRAQANGFVSARSLPLAGPPTQHGFRTNQARPPRQDRTGHAYNNDNSTASVNDMERTWFDIGSPKRKLSPERVQKRSIEEILLPQPANQHENGVGAPTSSAPSGATSPQLDLDHLLEYERRKQAARHRHREQLSQRESIANFLLNNNNNKPQDNMQSIRATQSSKKIASQAPDELPILALPGTRQTEKNEGGRGPAPSFAVGDPRAYLLRTMRMSSAIAAGEAASSRQRLSLLPLETSPSRSSRLQSARLVICTTPHQVEESLHKVGLWDRYVQEGALGTVDFMKETDLGVLESRLSSLVNKVYRSEEEGRLEDASAALSGLLSGLVS